MDTVVTRIPAEVRDGAKQIAALTGTKPAEQLSRAWHEYIQNHGREFATAFEKAADLIRNGNLENLAKFLNEDADEWAAEAASNLRQNSGS